MNYDEFAFANQQLASMLKAGIPLEGALRKLCETMATGRLRSEFSALEADLAAGTPLVPALSKRKLPDLYVQMVRVGVESGDLPASLILLADYYHHANSVWARLKGLMVYPVLVLVGAIVLSFLLFFVAQAMNGLAPPDAFGSAAPGASAGELLIIPFFLLVLLLMTVVAMTPPVRRTLRWRLPGFKESSLSQLAFAFEMMLIRGTPLSEAVSLLQKIEGESPAGKDLKRWQIRLSEGHGKVDGFAAQSRTFPRLFIWLVGRSGEQLAAGFGEAARLYRDRALYKIELLLYAALPVSICLLSALIITEIMPALRRIVLWMDILGDTG